ncbi:MAG: leucine--tRNA ligase [Parcubacteria group bacterium]|jgi:leucyl-tRNA synthetase|nr:leucine--tRNA ligase [Parcubacteria group bacterium]|tara:strand:+ start:3356 stop:5758 length:2403 start_codon:yes stop_codon:yes gene_type:complete
MPKYNPSKIEKKWQKKWQEQDLYKAVDFDKRPKKYIMVEFPYPSGDGLHMGHLRSYCSLDALARKKRMEGFNVLFPMGWDAFGLPTENYAIKTGIHPAKVTKDNIATFKKQMKSIGLSFDWSREIDSTDPKYYKWSQWIFIQFFKKGLAYQSKMPINWCPSCKIGLANEEVIGGKCERCGAETSRKTLKQWMLKITAYADRLIDDLEKVDYVEKIKRQQINWIGRSYGTEIDFKVVGSEDVINVFTTRADTSFGITAMVIAPEHSLLEKLITKENKSKVKAYVAASKKKSEFERTQLDKEKTGVFSGSYCINPVNNEKVPIWISDYVVATYGGGAVMIVPAHDKRDYQFAEKYDLEIREVISGGNVSKQSYIDYGTLVNSGQFSGLDSKTAIEKITVWLIKNKVGKKTVNYKLRDWVFSRQHYWGEPIPIIHCQKCGVRSVPEKDLPVKLPYVKKYEPTGTGESPLADIKEWVNVKCPECNGPAKRETDTMPNWAGSSWYFLRYIDSKNDKKFAAPEKLEYWLPVDLYNGGMEHTTLHLLYSRFWHKFLYDLGHVPTIEPYQRRYSHGVVLAEDGRKMSKSFGNVIKPKNVVDQYGADTLRVYEMFVGPFDQMISWSTEGVHGCFRFLNKVLALFNDESKITGKNDKGLITKLHQVVKKVDEDLDSMKFNTAIAAMMEFVNIWSENNRVLSKKDAQIFLSILSPFAPHLAEELWSSLDNKQSIFKQPWPEYDKKLIKQEIWQLIIQINGKVRDKVEVKQGISEKQVKELALAQEKVQKWLNNKKPKKIIYIPNRLVNLVV